jgi:hypothetical protein
MRVRNAVSLGLTAAAVAWFAAPVVAQPPAAAKPEWAAAHDLKVRKGKETEWNKALKVGVEVFKDPAANSVVAITAAGNLAVASDDATPGKKADWASGLLFSVRGASEEQFTSSTPLYGVEVFKGALAGHLLYVSEKGGIAVYPTAATSGDRDPLFQYGLSLKVRKVGSTAWTEAKAIGLEAYKDNNTGGMVYVTEGGLLTTAGKVPEKAPDAKAVKKPTPLFGLECKVRKADETEWSDKTQKFGIEVFRDEHTGTLIYISETGSVAAVPPPAEIRTGDKLNPQWLHAMALKARPGGESEFSKAKKVGIEVYKDQHTGYVLYVSETGAIAVLPRK